MATDGLRRSTRVRRAVKSYAAEQAEEADELALKGPPTKRKKKIADADDADVQFAAADASSEVEVTKVIKKRGKKTKVSKEIVDEPVPSQPSKKRKKAASTAKRDNDWHASAAENRIIRTKQQTKKLAPGAEETRLRAYVDVPSDKYHRFVESANTQRMFVIDRERGVEDSCHAHHDDCPCETIQIAGSTGNVYTVTISHLPSCSCPVGIFRKKGQEICCKHVLYVLHHVLKAPDELKYQNAFLTSELREIFTNAPALPSQVADDEPKDGNRKPVEDDCPICCMEFEADEEVVWCRAACGNNVHKDCFDQWANTKRSNVTCPFCRTPWQSANAPKKQKVGVANIDVPSERGGGGYSNVRHLLEYE
ncbi:hypothetical protein LTR36_004966 [Oleoguttula mirabilis]|uniref:Uncharacterized protein n=1 Tax=Oleoguttula mirabilis TaxID=1507867 RepID=A0AAV9JVQ7_9PEZI|nr:hypothetical protein LTR36_004966 [Oleoguttula mirabilis]